MRRLTRILRIHWLEFRLAMLTLDRVAEAEKHRQAMEKMDQQIAAIQDHLRAADAAAALATVTEGAQ